MDTATLSVTIAGAMTLIAVEPARFQSGPGKSQNMHDSLNHINTFMRRNPTQVLSSSLFSPLAAHSPLKHHDAHRPLAAASILRSLSKMDGRQTTPVHVLCACVAGRCNVRLRTRYHRCSPGPAILHPAYVRKDGDDGPDPGRQHGC